MSNVIEARGLWKEYADNVVLENVIPHRAKT
jgi:hypothetical protein